jgi:hypothetical protein
MTDSLTIPKRWDDVTPEWMTAAIRRHHPDAAVADVTLLLRDDGTNRRARFGLTYKAGSGPATVFAKAESDARGRREIHARNGNLFNEPLLFRSGVPLPVDHPLAYAAVIDEPALDYLVVMEDLLARDVEPLDATLPMTVDQAARGIRGLARLHSLYWEQVTTAPALCWVQPFRPEGWRGPLRAGVPLGLERAAATVPTAVRELTGETLVDDLWSRYLASLSTGPQTLLHGDAHIGNTYRLPDGDIGFLDWQVVRRGHWSHDVGYFLQSALTEDDRRRSEADLVEEHRRNLDVPAEARPTAEEAWLRYRATPVHGLTLWLVTLMSDAHRQDVSLTLAQRFAAAFEELETPAAIDVLGARGPASQPSERSPDAG